MTTKLRADLTTSIKVNPENSQIVLVIMAVVLLVLLIGAMVLLALGIDGWWCFLLFGVFLSSGIFWAWCKSQPDSDLQIAHPTSVTYSDGTILSTDPRTLKNPDVLNFFTQAVQQVLVRKPLPQPSGKVDNELKVVADSQTEAISIAEEINLKVQLNSNEILDIFGLSTEPATHLQEVTDLTPPIQP